MLCLLLISQLLQGLGLEDSELLNQFEEENWVFEIRHGFKYFLKYLSTSQVHKSIL